MCIRDSYKIVGNKAEALEFRATEKSAVCGRPLMELPTRPNLLIGAINREGRIITPGGRDTIEPGDTVVVVTAATGLDDLDCLLYTSSLSRDSAGFCEIATSAAPPRNDKSGAIPILTVACTGC